MSGVFLNSSFNYGFSESKQAKAEADDMFAIFNHALKSEEPVDIQAQMQKKQGKAK